MKPDVPEITVREAYAVTGRGAAVRPEEGLPPHLFGLVFDLELTAPDGSQRQAKGTVESMLLGTTPRREVFTYMVHGISASDVSPGTIIRALNIRGTEVMSMASGSAPEDAVKYELSWNYSDVKPGNLPPDPDDFDVHFAFMLRFPHIPPGEGHAEHFCFNVLSRDAVEREDISTPKRGYMGRESFSYAEITETVERSIADAFSRYDHERALEVLNEQYIRHGLDFSAGFEADLRDPRLVLDMIHRAFDGVERGQGTTLHEAMVMDDYGSEEEQRKARELDQETRWQDVPDSTMDRNSSVLVYLDMEGHRYYLPALMSWAIRNDDYSETYQSLLPLVAPRDVGRGHGEKFDVQKLIEEYSFTPEQVRAIYSFLVLAVVKGGQKVEEDHYPAMLKWRKAALEGDCPGGRPRLH